jgi:hypothetical protein
VAGRRSVLYSLDKDSFVLAVTGHAATTGAAEDTVDRRLRELARVDEEAGETARVAPASIESVSRAE